MTIKSTSVAGLWDKKEHQKILSLTFPMILANITTPLIGLVDTAVLGHMQGVSHLAGASLGALILTQVYWVCGFLRMSTTGMSAQAKGMNNPQQVSKVLFQSSFISVVIAIAILMFNQGLIDLGIYLSTPDEATRVAAESYFNVRVLGAPAALLNLVLIGWLIGQQMSKAVLLIQIVANLLNALLDVYFVYYLNWHIEGVAVASVIAEYFILLSSGYVVFSRLQIRLPHIHWFRFATLTAMLSLNSNMLIRNLALQACLAFVTIQGVRLGADIAAVNAILLQFFTLIALGLDGVAYAVEALVGESKGAKTPKQLSCRTYQGLIWSSVFAVAYSVIFLLWGEAIISLLTGIESLKLQAYSYLPMVVILPLIAHWCFLYDGVFVGITRGKAMRNSMLVSALVVFFPVWWLWSEDGNAALWQALLSFLGARGVTLGGYFIYLQRKGALVD